MNPTELGREVDSARTACAACAEESPRNECPKASRECGHHCNHSWTHDSCCWCGATFGEDGEASHA